MASDGSRSTKALVPLGEFGRPHGLQGEVRLKSYTAEPLAIASYGSLVASDGRTLRLEAVRAASGASDGLLIARVAGVGDRTSAEALNRITVSCERSQLGSLDKDDEVFAADLVGVDVVDCAGTVAGRVVSVSNFGGGDLLEIAPPGGGATALLPFTRGFVPTLDLPARRIVAALPDDFFAPPSRRPAEGRG